MATSGSPFLQGASAFPKLHVSSGWDAGTNAPSSNFVYAFDAYGFWVRDDWQEVCAHDAAGRVTGGSVDALATAFARGQEVKVGIRGLCDDLVADPSNVLPHEVFIQVGFCYYFTASKRFVAESHPLVRVRPAIPLQYASGAWDCGWLLVDTDGLVHRRLCDPYTLRFRDDRTRHALRWFAR